MRILIYQNFLKAYQAFPDKADIATKKVAEAMRMQWDFLGRRIPENEEVKADEARIQRDRAVKKAVELLLAFNRQAKSCGCPFLKEFVRKEDIMSCLKLLNEVIEATMISFTALDAKYTTKGVSACMISA